MRSRNLVRATKYSLFCLLLSSIDTNARAATPAPFIDDLSPPSADTGSGPISLTIKGAGIAPSARVSFNGQLLNPDAATSSQLTVTIPFASLATAGTATVSIINDPQSAAIRSNTRLFPVSTPRPAFLYTRSVSDQVRPLEIVTADFNSDGKPDLAVLNDPFAGSCCSATSFTINLLLGDGAGGFSPSTQYSLPPRPYFLRAADCNNDGKPDLIVASKPSTGYPVSLTVLLSDGFGGFSPAASPSVNIGTGASEVGDFNGDGNVDLMFGGSFNGPTLLSGDGAGHFGNPRQIPSVPERFTYQTMVAGDFNGDGKLDLVALAGGVIPTADVFLGDGHGNFQLSFFYLYGAWRDVSDMKAADFNNDGKLDFVITTRIASILVLIGDGAGHFTEEFEIAGNSSVARSSIEVADFNGDHNLDIILTGRAFGRAPNVVFYGDGNGSFLPMDIDEPLYPDSAVTVDDFNQDGRLDAAVIYRSETPGPVGSLTILLQTASPATPALYSVTDLCYPRTCNATVLGDSGAVAGPGFVVYPRQTLLDLRQLGYSFIPSAMNKSGVVVGKVPTSPTEAYLAAWTPQLSQMFNIAATGLQAPQPFINDRGDIAGTPVCGNNTCSIPGVIPSINVAGVRAIFNNGNVWAFGAAELYDSANGFPIDVGASSYLFNTAGHLLGVGSRAGQFFNYGSGFTPFPLPAGFQPQSFNNTGAIVGFQNQSATLAFPAIYTASGGIVPLASLLEPQTGWTLNNWETVAPPAPALKINNEGQILLTATKEGRTTSVLLTPRREGVAATPSLMSTQLPTSASTNPALGMLPASRPAPQNLLRLRPLTRTTDSEAAASWTFNGGRVSTRPAY